MLIHIDSTTPRQTKAPYIFHSIQKKERTHTPSIDSPTQRTLTTNFPSQRILLPILMSYALVENLDNNSEVQFVVDEEEYYILVRVQLKLKCLTPATYKFEVIDEVDQ